LAEGRPTPINLAKAGVAAALGDGGQAVDPLDIIEGTSNNAGLTRDGN
jgi:hypothetical protein